MIGSIIGGAMKIGGAIAGGAAKRKEAKRQAAIINQQKADNQTWYDRRYNEDSTQRADAQKAMQMARDTMKDRYNQATASAVVTGATDESIAAQKAAANQVLADTTSNIVVQGDARKDAIEQQYMANKQNFANQEMNLSAQRERNADNAMNDMANTGIGIAAGGLDSLYDEYRERKRILKESKMNAVDTREDPTKPLKVDYSKL